jgi:hypothetical protein
VLVVVPVILRLLRLVLLRTIRERVFPVRVTTAVSDCSSPQACVVLGVAVARRSPVRTLRRRKLVTVRPDASRLSEPGRLSVTALAVAVGTVGLRRVPAGQAAAVLGVHLTATVETRQVSATVVVAGRAAAARRVRVGTGRRASW